MPKIIFESHSTSTDNEQGIASGWLDPSLSQKGMEQANRLKERHEGNVISIVYVSDLKRSYETAKIAFGHLHIPIIQDIRLREWNYGEFNGTSAKEVESQKIKYLKTPFPQGESLIQAIERFESFKKDCLQHKKDILIIGHRATYYALEFFYNKTQLETLVTSQWTWQPGWLYSD